MTLTETPQPGRRARAPRPGWFPLVDPLKCTGCGWCVAACAPHVLSLQVRLPQSRKSATLHDPPRCTGCSDCAVACPFHAIGMRKVAEVTDGAASPPPPIST